MLRAIDTSRNADLSPSIESLPQRLLQPLSGEEPTTNSLSNRLSDQVLGDRVKRAVRDSSERFGHADRALSFTFIIAKVGVVEDNVARNLNATPPPRDRHGNVNLRRQGIRKLVQSERRLVTERSFAASPEPGRNESFLVGRRKVHEAEDATLHTLDTAGVKVVLEQWQGEACSTGLLGGEVPGLAGRQLVEADPVWKGSGGGPAWHA